MNRREFQCSFFTLAAGTLLAPKILLRAEETVTPSVAELYKTSIVVDSLCDFFASEKPSQETIAAVRNSGITAVNWTVSQDDYEETVNTLAKVEALADANRDWVTIVRRHAEIALAKRDGKIGILPGFQNTSFLEANPERIETFRKLGVRIMQITYNRRGLFGDGCLESANGGVTPAGMAAIRKMNDLGVAVDLSHSGYRTTAEGISASAKPVLITHSGCAAIYAHPRNKPDEILKALADRGGYFGVYLMPYLVASPTVPTRELVLAHLTHAINVCGTDHVGIGSDGAIEKVVLTAEQKAAFEKDIAERKAKGIGAPGEDRFPYVPDLNGPQYMEILASELAKRGQPSSVVEKVLGGNFHRVLGDIWGTDS